MAELSALRGGLTRSVDAPRPPDTLSSRPRFTEDQLAIRDLTRRFVRNEIVPHAVAWDQAEAAPAHIWRKLGELGLHGVCAPAELGGSDMGVVAWALVVEELAYGDCAIANQIGGVSFPFVAKLVQHGTERQKQEFLRPVVEGRHYIALLLSEPDVGSDLSNLKTRAVRKGDRWVVDGHKIFISGGSSAGAAILLASTDPSAGKRGLTAFLIKPHMPGYTVLRREKKLGHRIMDICQIALEGLELTDEDVLGPVGDGYRIILEGLDTNRIGVAAQAVGVAQAGYDQALGHARTRKSFGKFLIEHQAIGFLLADMGTRIEAARQLYHHAARLKEEGFSRVKEASMAKLFAAETAEFVCSSALQIFGGAGYLQGSVVEKLYRDQRVLQIYEGTNEVLKMIIQRDLIANGSALS
ncbi:acyl-CoA dehydrogenase family protein [Chelatococcus reniformis]|uniref:3-sulfinopropanoyl-CoA desulfinase n=1 Tax=Chelatococcus reniformis TaxID=1494448 RepID=A0A916ULY4_9HYPH|nr:acyl-CoA dehydrogenase family protein [Chelatococcus reniformis]GGC77797.1 acyl-CoA dehydrogenase [Chelatococcus reniformis]